MIVLVVLNFNDFDTASEFLARVSSYSNLDKIVVVDNHSTDGSFERLSDFRSEKIHVICAPDNGGYSAGKRGSHRIQSWTC